MSNGDVDRLLGSCLHLRLVDLAIGPCGMHWCLAPECVETTARHISRLIVVQCPLRVTRNRTAVYKSYPTEGDAERLRGLLLESRIDRIGIDPDDNSLRVLFDEHTLASAFPDPQEEEDAYWWSIHDVTTTPESGFVVYQRGVSPILPSSRG